MNAPTQPRIAQTPEVHSMPLVPHSLEGARIALDNAAQLTKTAADRAGRYDTARQQLGQNAVEQADLLAGSGGERHATLQSLRDEQSAATAASAESELNRGTAREHWLAFLIGGGGVTVNRPTPRSSMIAMEPRE